VLICKQSYHSVAGRGFQFCSRNVAGLWRTSASGKSQSLLIALPFYNPHAATPTVILALWMISPILPLNYQHVPLRQTLPPGLHVLRPEVRLASAIPSARSQNSLPLKLTFADPEKVRELARRGEALGTSEARQMLEHAIETGRGGIYLRLTPEQFARLRQP
jgi:hypothetical protein